MSLWTPFLRAKQQKLAPPTYPMKPQELEPSGSWFAFTCAVIAAILLIFAACAMNATHAWQLGISDGPFRAGVLAGASIGAAILAPVAFLAVVRGRGFGPRCVALLLAIGCLAYTSASSLGFLAGSRDLGVSERSIAADAYADRRALADAARKELASLKGQTKAVLDRRRELQTILAGSGKQTEARPVQKDAQAAALAFYMRAAGWQVTDTAVGTWLSLIMVLILEAAAALSLTVDAALRPTPRRKAVEAPQTATAPGQVPDARKPAEEPVRPSRVAPGRKDDDDQPPPKPRDRGGRPRDVIPAEAIAKIRAKGGKVAGSVNGIGKLIGTKSKTTAHRVLHELADAGLITLRTSANGVAVALA